MRIIRAEIADTDIFSENELDFGACCFFTEDKAHKYLFKITGRNAMLFTDAEQYVPEVIEEFLFYSSFVVSIKDKDGKILATRNPNEPYLHEISEIQPSQFFIDERKLENCKKWIKSPEDIFIPILIRDNKIISLDGHTRMRAALDLGYTLVHVYSDDYDETIFHFVDEAIRRNINSVFDMEIVSNEDYQIKWNKYCDDLSKFREKIPASIGGEMNRGQHERQL